MSVLNHAAHCGCYLAIVYGEVVQTDPFKLGGYGLLAAISLIGMSHGITTIKLWRRQKDNSEKLDKPT